MAFENLDVRASLRVLAFQRSHERRALVMEAPRLLDELEPGASIDEPDAELVVLVAREAGVEAPGLAERGEASIAQLPVSRSRKV